MESKILGNTAPVKVPCADCAPRQEFGFKLLFVPDKSALDAGLLAYLTQVLTHLAWFSNNN